MTYAQYGLIEATDYNTLAGGNPATGSGKINSVWSTGSGDAGYGQTAVSNVTVGTTVAASNWATLINNINSANSHQGGSSTGLTAPTTGGLIQYLSAVPTRLATLYTNRLNAAAQGTDISNATMRTTTWSNVLTFTHTVSFANGDAARYFFNAGGQLRITASHPSGTGINATINGLCANIGTLVISSPSTGSQNITIAGTTYTGFTKIGGVNTPTPTWPAANIGYYGFSTANANLYRQTANTTLTYSSSFINILAKTNGTVGSNQDKGNVITIYTIVDEVPGGLTVSGNATAGTTVTVAIRQPSIVNITNTWGTPTVTGSVTGS